MTEPALPAPSSLPLAFSVALVLALVASTVVRSWLANRQIRHVARHRDAVPEAFADRVPIDAHRKAADYTIARTRLASIDALVSATFVLAMTLLGGLEVLWVGLADWLPFFEEGDRSMGRQLALLAVVSVLASVVNWPLDWVRNFRIEQRFGFNRMTPGLWWADELKGLVLSLALMLPLAAAVIALMTHGGRLWWLWAWATWVAFMLAMLVLAPVLFARLFNRFEPLPDGPLRTRLEALLARSGFPAQGLFVMDGSKRSARGNAYFTGFGRARRIVLFDTLIQQLDEREIEAVLAHEIGHFKRRHIIRRIGVLFGVGLLGAALLGLLARLPAFFQGLGATPAEGMVPAVALALFSLALPPFMVLCKPLAARGSRRHEFEADEYAAAQTGARPLASALVKLYRDNASTLTPDPLHSAFHDSHPPASQRIGRLMTLPQHPEPRTA